MQNNLQFCTYYNIDIAQFNIIASAPESSKIYIMWSESTQYKIQE